MAASSRAARVLRRVRVFNAGLLEAVLHSPGVKLLPHVGFRSILSIEDGAVSRELERRGREE